MKYISIQKNCTGYNIDCSEVPCGIPIRHGSKVHFPRGVPGFETVRQWNFTANVAVHPFVYMEDPGDQVRFVCIESFRIYPNYKLHLPYTVAKPLAITPLSHIAVLSVVTVGQTPEQTTANLMSPLVINLDTLCGEQAILEHSEYPLKYCIWDHLYTNDDEALEEHPEWDIAVGS